jgi:hypothetical protein
MEKVSAVKSSLSVPPTEQAKWDKCKESLMTTLHELGGKMSFSNFVRLVVYGHKIEKRSDGLYLTVKLD